MPDHRLGYVLVTGYSEDRRNRASLIYSADRVNSIALGIVSRLVAPVAAAVTPAALQLELLVLMIRCLAVAKSELTTSP